MRSRTTAVNSRWVVMLLCGLFVDGSAAIPVFEGEKIFLPVLISGDASPEELNAATELGRILGKMSGLGWPVRAPVTQGEHGFYVGARNDAAGLPRLKIARDLLAPKAGESSPDGFRVESKEGSVFIEGATSEATEFAVAWLLQHEGGVRWYAPGPAGELIPRRDRWSLPEMYEVREPAYVSREITGLETPEEKVWARHNGLRGRLNFSHALNQVFSPKLVENPSDWAPLLKGRRYHPSSALDHDWQPNLALTDVAEHAGQVAATAFVADPTLASFSLGINDTVRFDESEATRAAIAPLRYFRGMPDYSPLVFTFMNRATECLHPELGDRYLGCLAYFWCENAPPFPVDRNVLPFVTTDRSQYYDDDYREGDLQLMSRWGHSGAKAFGLWDYAYGRGFLVPKMALQALADSVREGWHRGARGYRAEVEPQWGFDAGKVWILAQLLWEPDRPLEDLLRDFHTGYYGVAAAPMRRFFERAEKQWMTQTGRPFWLKYYLQEDQASLFPGETCREMRALLTEAARDAGGVPVIAERVERTSRAFAVTEAWQIFSALRSDLMNVKLTGGPGEEADWAGWIRRWVEAEATLRAKLAVATGGDLPAMQGQDLAIFVRDDPVPRLLWLAGGRDPAAPARILAAAGRAAQARDNWRALAELFAGKKLRAASNLVGDGSFASTARVAAKSDFLHPGFDPLPEKWKVSAMPAEAAKLTLGQTAAGDGRQILRIEGAWDTQVFQWIPVEPECTYLATARVRGRSSPGSDQALLLSFLDEAGRPVSAAAMEGMKKGVASDWDGLVLAGRSPDWAAWVGVGVSATRQQPGDVFEVASVELRGVITDSIP